MAKVKKKKSTKKSKKLHVKPTQEELDKGIKEVVEEAEALKDKPSPPPSPAPKPSKPPKEPPKEEPEPSPAPSKEIIKDMLHREKKKSISSAQEAQILHAKNKKITEALDEASQIEPATDEEMKVEYPDWDVMSDFEKKIARETNLANRRFASVNKITGEFKDSAKHLKKVNDFITDPETLVKYPKLEGRQDELRLFATKPSRRGLDFKDLVSAFLYNVETGKPKKKKKKSEMFPTGTGGPQGKPKTGKISVGDAIELRKRDSKKYKQMLLAGKIATDITSEP